MWQWHCQKWGGKNVVPKSGESKKKKKCYVYNIFTINHMWLVIISLKKKLWQTNCGNGIAEIGRKKKICDNLIMAMPLPK